MILTDWPTDKKYSLIYADPPWSYRDNRIRGGTGRHYKCLSNVELAGLPVRDLAKDDSIMMLWSTHPQLPVALRMMKTWGFEYKTVAFTWRKLTKKGTEFMGLGHYTRGNPEIILLGKRGKGLERKSKSVRNLQSHVRLAHSEKPDLFREKIVELYGDVKRIELFGRKDVEKWDVWGNEL